MAEASESTRRPVGVIVAEAMARRGLTVRSLGKLVNPKKPEQGRRSVQRALKMNGDNQGMRPWTARAFSLHLGVPAEVLMKPRVSEAERLRRRARWLREEARRLEEQARRSA